MKTVLLSALALFSIAGSAVAAPPSPAPASPAPAPTVSVSYADLNLATARDAATMLQRIRRAAGEACHESPGYAGNDPETVMRLNACYRQAVAGAVAGLNAPRVTEAFAPGNARKQLARLP